MGKCQEMDDLRVMPNSERKKIQFNEVLTSFPPSTVSKCFLKVRIAYTEFSFYAPFHRQLDLTEALALQKSLQKMKRKNFKRECK